MTGNQFWKRPFIWLSRFRYRKGYGVHSPFAFDFITQVVYQRTPYYKYRELREQEKRLIFLENADWSYESRKVKRLLFRLVNLVQPGLIVDVGRLAASSLYLQAAKEGAEYLAIDRRGDIRPRKGAEIGLLYLHAWDMPQFMREQFLRMLPHAGERTVFVIEGIQYSPAMQTLWEEMKNAEPVGITFDLYDLGILFFDKSKIKQDYIVNF